MDRYDVFITGFAETAPQPPAPTLQRVLGLSESDAEKLARSFPCAVVAHQDAPTVQRLGMALRQAGALVELRVSTASAEAKAPTEVQPSSSYAIGELVLEPASQPRAPQSAPAAAAPPPSASAGNAATGSVQMLDDGFGGEDERGPALELDYEAGVKKASSAALKPKPAAVEGSATNARPSSAKAAVGTNTTPSAQTAEHSDSTQSTKYAVVGVKGDAPKRGRINVRDKGPAAKGVLLGTVLPIAIVIATFAGAYRYLAPMLVPAARPPRQSVLARRRSRAVLAASQAKAQPQPQSDAAPSPGQGSAPPPPAVAGESVENAQTGSAAGLDWPAATALRARMHGVHQVEVEWPATQRSSHQECVLLDRKYETRLPALEKTGKRFEPSAEVAKQLALHVAALKATKRYKDRDFLPVCIAN